jgi:hypothetical protein
LLREFEKTMHSQCDNGLVSSVFEPVISSQGRHVSEEDIQIRKTLTFESFRVKFGSNYFKLIDSPGLNVNTDEWVDNIMNYINKHVRIFFNISIRIIILNNLQN